MDAKERARISMMINAAIEKGIEVGGEEDEGVQLLSQMAATLDAEMSTEEIEELSDAEGEEEPMMQEEDEQQEAPTGGLMAREGM